MFYLLQSPYLRASKSHKVIEPPVNRLLLLWLAPRRGRMSDTTPDPAVLGERPEEDSPLRSTGVGVLLLCSALVTQKCFRETTHNLRSSRKPSHCKRGSSQPNPDAQRIMAMASTVSHTRRGEKSPDGTTPNYGSRGGRFGGEATSGTSFPTLFTTSK